MIASLSLLVQMSEQYILIVDGITQQTVLFHNMLPYHHGSYHHGSDLYQCV